MPKTKKDAVKKESKDIVAVEVLDELVDGFNCRMSDGSVKVLKEVPADCVNNNH